MKLYPKQIETANKITINKKEVYISYNILSFFALNIEYPKTINEYKHDAFMYNMSIKKEIKDIERAIDKAEKNIKKEINYAEKWMYERKKFFIKLGFVIGFIALLLIISHIYLRTAGVGV